MVEAVRHMEYSWFLAGLLMAASSSNNMHLIVAPLAGFFLSGLNHAAIQSAYNERPEHILIPLRNNSHWPDPPP